MRFDIMTLFPDMVRTVLEESILGRAARAGCISVYTHQIRDYSEDKHRRVDDTPYGGGMGMLMSPPPIWNCYCDVLRQLDEAGGAPRRRTIYLSPAGEVLTQKKAAQLAADYDELILLCGHYEGVDRRVIEEIVDEEISIGDYVLTGGELPACVLVDCVSRLIPGVLADAECYEKESIASGLLEYPQYTRPCEWRGRRVPDILLSGDHAKIDAWRLECSLQQTQQKRPDLYEAWMQAHPPKPEKKKRQRKKAASDAVPAPVDNEIVPAAHADDTGNQDQ
ncbi:MAG: tRNA (guanosine(37)-N1)-methyltransferase TrmD [Clostridia bacterium]|nr:tRNA (guanosine(37)-N1)-methyltransferase TrmD [Clostridia bacterium]